MSAARRSRGYRTAPPVLFNEVRRISERFGRQWIYGFPRRDHSTGNWQLHQPKRHDLFFTPSPRDPTYKQLIRFITVAFGNEVPGGLQGSFSPFRGPIRYSELDSASHARLTQIIQELTDFVQDGTPTSADRARAQFQAERRRRQALNRRLRAERQRMGWRAGPSPDSVMYDFR